MFSKNLLFIVVLFTLILSVSCKKKSSDVAATVPLTYTGDYTKVNNEGKIIAQQTKSYDASGSEDAGTKWTCVRQNSKSLLWSVNNLGTEATDLLSKDLRATWFSANSGTASATCTVNSCDTEKLVKWANDNNLCGKNTWRIPTLSELQGIVSYDSTRANTPSVDQNYFPNSFYGLYWTSESNTDDPNKATGILFSQGGSVAADLKSNAAAVRIVSDSKL